MKAKTRRTEINIETHQISVVRFRNERLTGFCRECGKQVPVLVIENDRGMGVEQLVGAADVHMVATSDGVDRVETNLHEEK